MRNLSESRQESAPKEDSAQPVWRRHIRAALEFIFKNFAAPIVFFCVFQGYGAKPAIGFALLATILTLIGHRILRAKVSPFFLVASGFTVLFGGIDLVVQTPRFFRLEPFAQNSLMSILFLASVFIGKPIAAWFVAALPEEVRPQLDDDSHRYLRNLTLIWSGYFLMKGLLFLYLALQVDLGRLVILRTVIGGGSMAIMFGAEFLYRKYLWRPRR